MSVISNTIKGLHPAYFALVMSTGIISVAANFLGFTSIAYALFYINIISYAILLPILAPLGIDQVHFGIIICFNLIIGIITPPMGIGLFVAARVAETTPELVFRATVPFLVPLLLGLATITAFPVLTLWLPDLVFGHRP